MGSASVVLSAALLASGPATPRVLPQLVVEAAARHAGLAAQLEALPPQRFAAAMGLIGLEHAGAPISVALVTERSPEAAAAPAWVAGYAYGALGRIVLFVERTPPYPDGSLEALLDHEVAHVLTSRAAAHRPLPRWFNEGVAMVAGHAWGLADTSRLTLAILTRRGLTLADIDDLFAGHSGEVARAYALAGAMVRDLLRRHDRTVVARVMAGVRSGRSFDEAFRSATGTSLASFEAAFWRRHSFLYRWVPLLGSSVTLWFAITLLALVAFRRRRRRDAEIRARWHLEEERERRQAEPTEPIN